MLEAIGVPSVEALFDRQIPEAVRLRRPLELPGGQGRAGCVRASARARCEERIRRRRAELPRRGYVRPLRAGADRHADVAFGVPHPLHPLPAGDLPGRAAGDVRVSDGDLRADRAAGRQRLGLRGTLGSRGGGLPGEAAQRRQALRCECRAAPTLDRDAAHPGPRLRDGGCRGPVDRRRHRPPRVGTGDRRRVQRGDLRPAELLRRGRGCLRAERRREVRGLRAQRGKGQRHG